MNDNNDNNNNSSTNDDNDNDKNDHAEPVLRCSYVVVLLWFNSQRICPRWRSGDKGSCIDVVFTLVFSFVVVITTAT